MFAVTWRHYRVHFADIGTDWWKNWGIGKWAFAHQITGLLNGFGLLWVIGMILDNKEVGLFSACLQLVFLGNPLLLDHELIKGIPKSDQL